MADLEFNKVAASVLVAGLFAMGAGKVADGLYSPEKEPKEKGIEIAVLDDSAGAGTAEEEVLDIAALMASADAAAGKKTAKKCTACHSFESGGPHKVGPNLAGVVGSAKASKSGYTYSDALKSKAGTWGYEELFAFLKKPKDYVPGTKMAFAGLRKPEDLANMVAYMEQHK